MTDREKKQEEKVFAQEISQEELESVAGGDELEGTLQLRVTTSGGVEGDIEIDLDVGSDTYTLKDLLILGQGDHLGDVEEDGSLVHLANDTGIVLIVDEGIGDERADAAMGGLADKCAVGQTLTAQGGHLGHADGGAVGKHDNRFGDGLVGCFKGL